MIDNDSWVVKIQKRINLLFFVLILTVWPSYGKHTFFHLALPAGLYYLIVHWKHAAMHVTNKKSGNLTQLHDKYFLTSLYTKRRPAIFLNKLTSTEVCRLKRHGHVRRHLLLCISHHLTRWLVSKIIFVQVDYELLLQNKESTVYWCQNTNRCP